MVEQAAKFDIKNKLNQIHQSAKTANEQEKAEKQAKHIKIKRLLALAGGVLLTASLSAVLYQYFQVKPDPAQPSVNVWRESTKSDIPADPRAENFSDRSQQHGDDRNEGYGSEHRHEQIREQFTPQNNKQEKTVPQGHEVQEQDSMDNNHRARAHKKEHSLSQSSSILDSSDIKQVSSTGPQDSFEVATSSSANHTPNFPTEKEDKAVSQPSSPCQLVKQMMLDYQITRPCFGDHDGMFTLLQNTEGTFTQYSLDGGEEFVDQWEKLPLSAGHYTLIAKNEQGCLSAPMTILVNYDDCDYQVQPALYRFMELSIPNSFPTLIFEVRNARTGEVVFRQLLEQLSSFVYKGISDEGVDLPLGSYVFTFSSGNNQLVSRGYITVIK